MAAVEVPRVEQAQFLASRLGEYDCLRCFDTGHEGGSGFHVGPRCEWCRGPALLTRLLRAVGLGELLAAPSRELRP